MVRQPQAAGAGAPAAGRWGSGRWGNRVLLFEESLGPRQPLLARPTAPGAPPGPPARRVQPRFAARVGYDVAVRPVLTSGRSVHDAETWFSSQAVKQIPLRRAVLGE